MKIIIVIMVLTIFSMSESAQSKEHCTPPTQPASYVPNGLSATTEEMLRARSLYQTFDQDLKKFGRCLSEYKTSIVVDTDELESTSPAYINWMVTVLLDEMEDAKRNERVYARLLSWLFLEVDRLNQEIRVFQARESATPMEHALN